MAVPDQLQIRLIRDFKPRANIAYSLVVDGEITSGVTDADGWVRVRLNPLAVQARLVLDNGNEEYPIALGHIDPIDTVSGIQGRLGNLGFLGTNVSGELDDDTRRALSAFQSACGLRPTGDIDNETLTRLDQEYGC